MAFVTWKDVSSDGSQLNYEVIFPFLSRDHVQLKVAGVIQPSSAFTFNNDSQIKLVSAVASGIVVRVGRSTPQTVQTDFKGGVLLPESDLDDGYLQMLYHIQEMQDTYDELIAGATVIADRAIIKDLDGDTSVDTEASTDEDIIRFVIASTQRGKMTSAGIVFGIDASPLGQVHAISAASGATPTVSANADEGVFEGSGHSGITILSGNSSLGSIHFGDDGDNDISKIVYDHSSNSLIFYSNIIERLRINETEVVFNETGTTTNFRVESDGSSTIFSIASSANRVGIALGNLAPTDGLLHIQSASAGSVTAPVDNDELVIEGSGKTGMVIIVTDANEAMYGFKSPTGEDGAGMLYTPSAVPGFDKILWKINSQAYVEIGTLEVVVNQFDQGIKFRVEGANTTQLIRTIPSDDRVGIALGDLVPTDGLLHIQSVSAGSVAAHANADELVIEGGAENGITILSSGNGHIYFGKESTNNAGQINYISSSNIINFYVGGSSEICRISTLGFIINDTGVAATDFRAESDGNTHKLFLDSGVNLLQTAAGTAATALANIGGVLDSLGAATTTTGTDEEDLWSYTLPGNSLVNNGQAVRIKMWGICAANSNNKTLKVYFDGVAHMTQGPTASNAGQFFFEFIYVKTGDDTQAISSGIGAWDSVVAVVGQASDAADDGADIIIKVTGTTPSSAGDITLTGLIAEILQ